MHVHYIVVYIVIVLVLVSVTVVDIVVVIILIVIILLMIIIIVVIVLPAAVRSDMVLHQTFRARRVRKTGIGGEVRHGVASGVSCETSKT